MLYRIIFPFLLITAIILVSCNSSKKKSDSINAGPLIPHFEFNTLDGKKFTEADLGDDKPVLLVYSNNECGFCAQQNREITLHIEQLQDAEVVMITPQSSTIIKSYKKLVELEKDEKLKILSDPEFMYPVFFGTGVMPAVHLYDSNHRLVKYFDEQTNFSMMRMHLDSLAGL